MKRILLVLLSACICFLCGCNSRKLINGQVVEFSNESGSVDTYFVVLTDAGEKIGILIEDQTSVWSLINEIDIDAFKSGALTNTIVSVECSGSANSMTDSDGGKIKTYTAKKIEISAILMENTLSLSDGTKVNVWKGSDFLSYQLSDGTEVLRVQNPTGPDNVYVGGIESFDDLSETVKSKILTYYETKGLLYDVNRELERAYTDYQHIESRDKFSSYWLSQDISLIASNEKVLYFMTSVYLPTSEKSGQEVQEIQLGDAFDRETGQHIDNIELFSCSEEEVGQKLLDIAQIVNSTLREEMESAFDPKYIVLFPDNLEVSFPAGTLSSQEYCYILGLDYDETLCQILNDWAVPEHSEQ